MSTVPDVTPPRGSPARRHTRRPRTARRSRRRSARGGSDRISRLCSPKRGEWRAGRVASTSRQASRLLPAVHLRVRQVDPEAAAQQLRVVVDRAAVEDRPAGTPAPAAAPASCGSRSRAHASITSSSSSWRARRSARAGRRGRRGRSARRRPPLAVVARGDHDPLVVAGARVAALRRAARRRLPRCTGSSPRSDAAANAGPIICADVSRCARSIQAPWPVRRRWISAERDRAGGACPPTGSP